MDELINVETLADNYPSNTKGAKTAKKAKSDPVKSPDEKKTEKAKPGYYSVILEDEDINVELTASQRVGFHKYRFPYNKNAFVTIDLTHRDEVLESSLKQINEFEIEH